MLFGILEGAKERKEDRPGGSDGTGPLCLYRSRLASQASALGAYVPAVSARL